LLPYLKKNKKLLVQLNIKIWPEIRYPALPDIRQGNLVSGQIPDIIKAGLSGQPVYP
jgi:hypothetical protein